MAGYQLRFSFRVDLTTSKAVVAALDGVKAGVRNRVLKAAIAKSARGAAQQAKRWAPRGPSGTLKKSLGTVYRRYQGGLVWVYAVGPRKGIEGVGPVAAGGKVVTGRFVPTKYAHLAEAGRKALTPVGVHAGILTFVALRGGPRSDRKRKAKGLVWAKRVKASRKFFFMRRAYAWLTAQKYRMEQDVLAGIKREIAKYRAKGKSVYY